MINTAKHTLQKFTQKYKHLCEKRNKGKQKHLLNPGEYDDLMKKIQEINGYSLDDKVEEAKN